MHIRKQLSKKINILFLVSFALLFYSPVWGQDNNESEKLWNSFETRYTSIHYQSDADLLKFHKQTSFQKKGWSIKQLLNQSSPDNIQEQLSENIDLLFERVQEILDMRKKMPKVIIMAYPDKKELHQAYEEIYEKECRIRGWYRYKNNTVYLAVTDMHVGMLAHELAHAIINHYLLVKPPVATAEILARYVDSHLQE